MSTNYIAGQTVDFLCTFTDGDGALVDPPDVLLRLRPPSGPDLDYSLGAATVARVSIGLYRVRATLGVVGEWPYRWQGTGSVTAIAAGHVNVRPDALA